MGLLGDNWDDPRSMAALNMAAGLLAGGGPSRNPTNLGMGLLGGLQQYQSVMDADAKKKLLEREVAVREGTLGLQQDEIAMKLRAAEEQAKRSAAMQAGLAGIFGGAPQPGQPGFDFRAASEKQTGVTPSGGASLAANPLFQQYQKLTQAGDFYSMQGSPENAKRYYDAAKELRPKLEEIFNAQGQRQKGYIDPSGAFTSVGGAEQPQAPWEFVQGQDGRWGMRPGVFEAKRELARAGATQIGMPKIDLKVGEGVAGQIGPMLRDSRIQALGAVQIFDSANRIGETLDRGDVITGVGADARLRLAQFGQFLGVGGKDDAEKIVRTREVIRGLAETAIQARKELQGQGQVTENEAKAVEKARSGDINELTVDELRLIVGLNKKYAKWLASNHQDLIEQARSNPGSASLAPFFNVRGLNDVLQYQPPDSGWSIRPKGQ